MNLPHHVPRADGQPLAVPHTHTPQEPRPPEAPIRLERSLSDILGLAFLGLATIGLALVPTAAGATNWEAIDRLRLLLKRSGVRVVQRDCTQRGLQGLYSHGSDTIVICRVHSNPREVWNTLAHEATHRMQACRGGAITDPNYHRSMAEALAKRSPQDLASLRLYPARQRAGELEARYTAQLPPSQVIQLFERYCG
ncbi:hypothetical protein [Synechococcus sp. CCY9202]|uniref:hypothetical protein n=1 Tax=Synechococcus sp. CCY9202 TaxID=174698 RepID=UPI002B211CA8|nr:hypothetical protein [Synechococcus sp. CCY9202]MEA5423591.1 hypothetical protein [Synechococcus sp. CCY9202]